MRYLCGDPVRARMTQAFVDGFHPFWFWNDRLTPDRIRDQIARMHEQGIKGFFVHCRQGLAQPYMSARFVELVALAIDEGTSRGMAVHLYDEYPYPSGAAGGAVTQSDPGLMGTRLQPTHKRTCGGFVRWELPPGRVLHCVAAPVLGGTPHWPGLVDLMDGVGMVLTCDSFYDAAPQPYNDRRYFADTPVPVLEAELSPGDWELWAVTECLVEDHKYWGHFPDMTNPAAVASFVQFTHERYRSGLGQRLAQVTSMFVDEVEPEVSRSVLAELQRRRADDFGALVLAYSAPTHPRHLEALRVLQELRLELFMDAFEDPIGRWCRSHGLRYSGEKPSIRLRQLAAMDVPGCEPGHTKAGAPRSDLLQADIRGNARATASAAYFYGKEGSLCECFHSLGWGATLQDAKLISESLIALGTRWLVPHAFFYSTRGLRKHDAPPSFLQMPYWPMFGQLTARVERLMSCLQGTIIDASVGIVEPSGGLPDEEQRACYEELQHRLLQAHYEFITVDTDILGRGSLGPGGWSYLEVALRALVMPPMRDPEPELLLFLERFEGEGGFVLRVETTTDLDAAMAELARHLAPPALSSWDGGTAADNVICARRRGAAAQWLFLVNVARQPVDLRIEGDVLRAIDLGCPPPNLLPTGEGSQQRLRLAAFESALICVGAEERDVTIPVAEPVVVDLSGDVAWHAKRLSPNILRLGRWRMTVADSPSGTRSALVEPAPIVNQLGRSCIPFSPDIVDRFGLGPTITLPQMTVRYETSFECRGVADLAVVMQHGALGGQWALSFDGSGPHGPQDFMPREDLVEDCIGIDVRCSGLSSGAGCHVHRVTVDVIVNASHEGMRDSMYMAGDFAVFAPSGASCGPSVGVGQAAPGAAVEVPLVAELSPPGAEVLLGNWEASGLPYYAGLVEYSRPLGPKDIDAVALNRAAQASADVIVDLRLPDGCEDAAEVAFGEGPYQPIPWSPRRARVARDHLASAPTQVRVRLATALARMFEGRWFDPASHSYREVELARRVERP